MINLQKDFWITKLFWYAERLKGDFLDRWYDDSPKRMTNLCYVSRTILIYLPFIYLMQILAIVAPICALIINPIRLLGTSWWHIPGWILGVLTVICIVFGLIALLYHYVENKRLLKELAQEEPKVTTMSLFKEYLKGKKEKICPVVIVERSDKL